MLQVMERKCDQCLFTPERIVSPRRMAEVLRSCRRRGKERHFVCHKSSMVGGNACCRGFYDQNPEATALMQIAGRLGMIEFIPVPDEKGQA